MEQRFGSCAGWCSKSATALKAADTEAELLA